MASYDTQMGLRCFDSDNRRKLFFAFLTIPGLVEEKGYKESIFTSNARDRAVDVDCL
jgi:hypothetical protein